MSVHTERWPTPSVKRRITATIPARNPSAKSAAPSMPKASNGRIEFNLKSWPEANVQGPEVIRLVRSGQVDVAGAPLKDLVWFRAGGPAEILYRPADVEDLATFLYAKPADVNVCVIGVGSNLLVRDGGVSGVVIRLPAAFSEIKIEGTRVRAGGAALDANVARAAADAGISGLEFMRGIPGTVGGALKMNAGCYGGETWHLVEGVRTIDRHGVVRQRAAREFKIGYRSVAGPAGEAFVAWKDRPEGTDAPRVRS